MPIAVAPFIMTRYLRSTFLCAFAYVILVSATSAATRERAALLQKFESQTPLSYPGKVLAVPEDTELAGLSDAQLMRMLEHYNPGIRSQAAKGLAMRKLDNVTALVKLADSPDVNARRGAAKALVALIESAGKPPEGANREPLEREELDRFIQQSRALPAFLKLAEDSDKLVRHNALRGLLRTRGDSREAVSALVKLTMDENPFVAQDARIAIDKRLSSEALEDDAIGDAIVQSFNAPLPRGRGHMIGFIKRMDFDQQKEFLPLLLDHIRWEPTRDTMFGGGGVKTALQILKDHKHKELPTALLDALHITHRGRDMFETGMEELKTYPKAELKQHKEAMLRAQKKLKYVSEISRERKGERFQKKYEEFTTFMNSVI